MKRAVTYLLVFVCLLALAGTFSWMALKRGIDIAHFSVASMSISGLSISLDQGFILRVDQIDIADTDTPSDIKGFEKQIPRIKKWGYLIQEIGIHRLTYRDRTVGITYRNGQFQVDGTDFTLKAAIKHDQGTFLVNLSRLEIKPLQLTFNGKGSFERTSNIFLFTGTFESPWGGGSLNIKKLEKQVDIQIQTSRFTDLGNVLAQFPLNPEVITWVTDNITAEEYRVEELHLQFDLSKMKDFGPENISGTAVADSAAIRFHPDLPPVQCKRIHISFQDDRLSFKLDQPTYKGKSLDGSSVSFFPIIRDGRQLIIRVQTETGLDRDILDILDSYNMRLPFRQKSGVTKADLTLTFDLPGFSLNTNGTFSTGSGEWLWGEHSLQTQGTVILLNNNTITVKEAKVAYADILNTTISGSVDLTSKQADLECDIKKLQYKVGETTVLEASNKKMPVKINFGEDTVVVELEALKTSLHLGPDKQVIAINSLPAITPLVPFLQNLNITDGNVHTTLQDIDHIRFSGEINFPNPYLSLDDKPVTLFRFEGARTPEETDISINDGRIAVAIADKIRVNLQDYLVTVDTNNIKGDSNFSVPFPLEITGPATLLKVKKLQVLTQKFKFNAVDSDISFDTQLEKGNILFEFSPPDWNFTGRDLNATTVDKLVDKVDMTGGIFNISLNGTSDKIEAYIDVKNILIENTKLLNNLLAFINTIPALITFSSPGFDRDGYLVNAGVGHLTYRDKVITIHQLRTDGETVNIEVQGWIDQKNRTLKLDVELFALKDYSKIVSKIPLAGYALLGSDGTLSTSLEATGSLDKPDIETNLTRDILSTPIHVIRRTLQWPFKVFENDAGKDTELPESE